MSGPRDGFPSSSTRRARTARPPPPNRLADNTLADAVQVTGPYQVLVEPMSRPAAMVWIGLGKEARAGPLNRARVEGRRDESIHARCILDRRVCASDADAVVPPADRPHTAGPQFLDGV